MRLWDMLTDEGKAAAAVLALVLEAILLWG